MYPSIPSYDLLTQCFLNSYADILLLVSLARRNNLPSNSRQNMSVTTSNCDKEHLEYLANYRPPGLLTQACRELPMPGSGNATACHKIRGTGDLHGFSLQDLLRSRGVTLLAMESAINGLRLNPGWTRWLPGKSVCIPNFGPIVLTYPRFGPFLSAFSSGIKIPLLSHSKISYRCRSS